MTIRYLTAGESHGKCLTAIVEGIPSNFPLNKEDINIDLRRRQQGYGRGGRMRIEKDAVKVNSGVRLGRTTGSPICLELENKDFQNWQIPMSVDALDLNNPEIASLVVQKKITHVRPGHADLTGALKYNLNDVRDVLERSSARETAIRVAVGGLCKTILKRFDIKICSHVLRIGHVASERHSLTDDYDEVSMLAEKSELRCADPVATEQMKEMIDDARERGDTLGGIFEVVAVGCPVGLGSYVHWDRKLDGQLAQAFMSIQAIKSVNIGLGKMSAHVEGSKVQDEVFEKGQGQEYRRKTNRAGGVEGGMSNGEPIIVRAAMKPIPTLRKPLNTIDLASQKACSAHYERSDVCAVPACSIVGEAVMATVVLNAFLEKFGGDSYEEIRLNYENYKKLYQSR